MNINTLLTLCAQLKLSTIQQQLAQQLEQAQRQQLGYDGFLHALLQAEVDARTQRRTARRIKEAAFPTVKSLDSFDFQRAPHLPEALIRQLATGTYFEPAQPIILIGEPGTGKTHLASALGYAAACQGIRVRFITTSQLVNQLVEAKDSRTLSTITQRFARYRLLILDELGYVPLAKTDAELLFQVISQRQERLPMIITTNLPFSEWTSVFPDHRLCKAFIDRVTHRAHIIESGQKSLRFEDSLAQQHKPES